MPKRRNNRYSPTFGGKSNQSPKDAEVEVKTPQDAVIQLRKLAEACLHLAKTYTDNGRLADAESMQAAAQTIELAAKEIAAALGTPDIKDKQEG